MRGVNPLREKGQEGETILSGQMMAGRKEMEMMTTQRMEGPEFKDWCKMKCKCKSWKCRKSTRIEVDLRPQQQGEGPNWLMGRQC